MFACCVIFCRFTVEGGARREEPAVFGVLPSDVHAISAADGQPPDGSVSFEHPHEPCLFPSEPPPPSLASQLSAVAPDQQRPTLPRSQIKKTEQQQRRDQQQRRHHPRPQEKILEDRRGRVLVVPHVQRVSAVGRVKGLQPRPPLHLRSVQPIVRLQTRPAEPREDPHGGEAVRVSGVSQEVHAGPPSQDAHASPHGGEAVPLRALRQAVRPSGELEETS